ncbi:coiled-coil domain-containing protein 124 [Agrilus planipennis]|uniref:Coiled-coil domain-containing protein 124 n=1 Tax=Agrilus planipennis TaxID=224129 RepID=A0A1W4XHM5_AGRPL|nr:coiled-coil domain-containing protein 124 [Agrilus planipennis]XP_018332291.1 coiled-coil domain-containing protein 124 [Agrilus planipennis]XP_018332292.1 coiled-coil domain-containing protein 124 [Agrilus planipennis]
MPKKFQGENSKASAARARKTASKEAETAKKQKDLEDAYWKEDDKHILRKQQRKEEQERRKQEQLEKKAEKKALLEKEQASLSKISAKVIPPSKITRAQISEKISQPQPLKKEKEKIDTHLDVPLEENINRLTIDGEEARTIDEAIKVLGGKDDADKHPEKRMKAAYNAFEERRLKELKDENPTLRLSQLKQLVFKEWQKSPENPLNKA